MVRHAGQPVVGSRPRAWVAPVAALALAVGIAAMVGCSSAVAAPAARPTVPRYLFSIPSGSGSLTGPDDRHLTLRLFDARRYLTRFTDRPLRRAAVVANVDFARRFTGYFASAEPNAVLTYTPRGAQIPVSIVLTIGAPRWNATRFAWTFKATRIRKTPDSLPGTTVRIRPPVISNPPSFKHATLLIDDSRAATINRCTIPPYAECLGMSNPIELSGGGVADSLGGFLQHLVMTSITHTANRQFFVALAVDYSYAVTEDAPDGPTGMVPVLELPLTSFDPTTGPHVQPGGLMCGVESTIAAWESVEAPAAGGAYMFNLALYGPGQRLPMYSAILRYALPPSGVTSLGCA
jgi:hypothetical protein